MRAVPESLQKEYPFASHYLALPGGRMHYVDEGQGEAVVMLHGNPTWSFFYRDLVKRLSPGYRCIVPDHLGMGFSDKPAKGFRYRLADHIANVSRLVDHLGLEHFHLVVHDWGGAIGMGLAERFPLSVRKLVVMNTAAFPSKRLPLRIAVCRWPVLGALLVRGFNGFAWPATWMAVRRELPLAVKAGYLAPYNSWANRIGVHRFVQDIPMSPRHPSYGTLAGLEQGLAVVRDRPMLLLWGMRDFCFDESFLRTWQKYFPGAVTHELPEAGHYLMEDAPEETLPVIEDFLRA